eukprot:gene1157-1263_t
MSATSTAATVAAAPPREDRTYLMWVICLNIALYGACFQMQRPIEPFLVERLKQEGEDQADVAREYARLQSFFAIMNAAGSLVSGRLLDLFGIRGSFLLSYGASLASYAILSQAHTKQLLYCSKLPSTFQSAFLCAQVALSRWTAEGRERARALGLLTMSYTLGSVVGPALGGWIGASGDYYLGAKIAVVGTIVSIVWTLAALPTDESPAVESSTSLGSATETSVSSVGGDVVKSSSSKTDSKTEKAQLTPPDSGISLMKKIWSSAGVLIAAKMLSSIGNSMFLSILPIVFKNQFSLAENSLGLILSFASLSGMISSGFVLERVVHFLEGDIFQVIQLCMTGLIVCSVIQAFFATPVIMKAYEENVNLVIFVSLYFLSMTIQYLLSTAISSESTGRVEDQYKGTLLGLEHSVFAAARIVAPQAGVWILLSLSREGAVGGYGVTGVAIASTCCYLLTQCLLVFGEERSKEEKKKRD